jgi:hypothetical protein
MTEHAARHVGMSIGSWIAFGSLLLCGLVYVVNASFHYGGIAAEVQLLKDQNADLRRQAAEVPALRQRIETAEKEIEKAYAAATREARLREDDDRELELRLAENGWRRIKKGTP